MHRRFSFVGSWADVAMFKVTLFRLDSWSANYMQQNSLHVEKNSSMLKKQSGFVSKTLRSKEERIQAIFN